MDLKIVLLSIEINYIYKFNLNYKRISIFIPSNQISNNNCIMIIIVVKPCSSAPRSMYAPIHQHIPSQIYISSFLLLSLSPLPQNHHPAMPSY